MYKRQFAKCPSSGQGLDLPFHRLTASTTTGLTASLKMGTRFVLSQGKIPTTHPQCLDTLSHHYCQNNILFFFIRQVLVTWYFKNLCVNHVFIPHSVVMNKPPRKAVCRKFGNFMPTCCFTLILSVYICPISCTIFGYFTYIYPQFGCKHISGTEIQDFNFQPSL